LRATLPAVALALFAAALFGRQPVAPETGDLTGKYDLPSGGYLVVSIDDADRLEGFFERNGEFGRLSGKVDGGVASATWVQDNGLTACSTAVEGSKYWGKMTLVRDAAGAAQIAWRECDGGTVSSAQIQ
jgi:hypothetical protein